MGDHYIPRFYLKGFTETTGADRIWVYERGKDIGFSSGVKSVANENNFYTREVETYLANVVEYRANPVITKIREQNPISPEEKTALAEYMMVLWRRVPNHKLFLRKKYPEVMERAFNNLDDQLVALLEESPDKKDIINKKREELEKFRNDEEEKETFLNETWITNISVDKTAQTTNVLRMMNWCFWISDQELFITSDNPLFFFDSIGIGNEKSEVSFPISKNIALWATWRSDIKEGTYFKARKQIVHEINSRTIKNTTRYVYCSNPSDWIIKTLSKKRIYLSLIEIGK